MTTSRDVAKAAADKDKDKKKKPRPGTGRIRPRYRPEEHGEFENDYFLDFLDDINLTPWGTQKGFFRALQDEIGIQLPESDEPESRYRRGRGRGFSGSSKAFIDENGILHAWPV